jgi:hypothetical protein
MAGMSASEGRGRHRARLIVIEPYRCEVVRMRKATP